MSRTKVAAISILAFGLIAAGGVLFFSNGHSSAAAISQYSPSRWTDATGAAIFTPACGSGIPCSATSVDWGPGAVPLSLTNYGIWVYITGSGHTIDDTQTITTPDCTLPTPDIKANGADGPIVITYNTAATLSWTSAHATSCTVSPGGWTGTSNPGQSTGNITASQSYTLSCTGPGGTTGDTVVINTATLTISPISKSLNPTQTVQLTATYDPDGPGGAGPSDVTASANWSSDNTAAATVNNGAGKGLVTAVSSSVGAANITAAYNGLTSNVSLITVLKVPGFQEVSP
ncbi:MAG: Ig-like domain-containing protein [Candidatus Sungbacteria bacterium]|uniref:Ig-like domain-containing protein n=1 Tax=Candidatus Sungiibacteriota bacterium TaxID=2750080 RepID=A0A9D6LRB1_9BACT|nr:Ig-like domain-containing protein [Candidatus Sungbacteria bacterium]